MISDRCRWVVGVDGDRLVLSLARIDFMIAALHFALYRWISLDPVFSDLSAEMALTIPSSCMSVVLQIC